MQKRSLGQSAIEVSVIGLGTVKFGRNQAVKYPQAFDLPSDQQLTQLLNEASDLGINFLDTAPAYGSSEQRLGQLLKGRRQDWVIASKAGEEFVDGQSTYDFSSQAIFSSVERSLQRLKTDYLDLLLIHSNGDDESIIEQDQVFVSLEKLKQAGKIRAYGMSTKTLAGGLKTIEYADVAMVTYHPDYLEDSPIIKKAHETHKGILIKKALASGRSIVSVNKTLDFIFSEPGVTSVIIGTINPLHLRDNVKACPLT